MPKVSVIIPVYGVEKYIERCARSLFEQTLDDIEYIFVDDCTPDKSIEILESIIEEYRLRFAEEKKTVRIVRMPTNSGLPAVRRHGIQLATGDYIIHCDSDDWVDVDMYRAMYEKAIEGKADVIVSDYMVHDGDNILRTSTGCKTDNKQSFLMELMFQKKAWSVWNKMIRKELYDTVEYYPIGAMGEDMVLTLQLVYGCQKLSFVNRPLYYYFLNTNSISHKNSSDAIIKKVEQLLENYSLIKSFFSNKPDFSSYKKGLDYIAWTIKSKLYSKNKALSSKRKKTFPLIEFKVLFYRGITCTKRRLIIKGLPFSFGLAKLIDK